MKTADGITEIKASEIDIIDQSRELVDSWLCEDGDEITVKNSAGLEIAHYVIKRRTCDICGKEIEGETYSPGQCHRECIEAEMM